MHDSVLNRGFDRSINSYVNFHYAAQGWLFVFSFVTQILASQFAIYWIAGDYLYPESSDSQQMTIVFAITALLISPPIETFIFQTLPYELLRKISSTPQIRFIGMWLAFVLGHVPSGIEIAIQAGVIAGFFLAVAYSIARRKDSLYAYWVTTAIHFSLNACLLLYVTKLA